MDQRKYFSLRCGTIITPRTAISLMSVDIFCILDIKDILCLAK